MFAVPSPAPRSLELPHVSELPPEEAAKPLVGMTLAELTAMVASLGEPKFRAQQLYHWLYVKNVRDFGQMTDLSKGFRQKLEAAYGIGILALKAKQVSRDGTIKYLFALPDGQVVEAVLIEFTNRKERRTTYSLCMSTQVGCAVDCQFCATGKLGFKRQLSVAEIVDQYLFAQADSGKEIRNIVFMGQGEPLLNYDNLIPAIDLLNSAAEVGHRRITVSTAGIVPKIQALATENRQITLAVSLHAPTDALREQIMPINRKWSIATLMESLHQYYAATRRRITIEYILLHDVNDQPQHAHQLGQLLQSLHCNVNLIPYNPIGTINGKSVGYQRPRMDACEAFRDVLVTYGKKVTLRMERGADIDAACGQLANKLAAPVA
jgi:23S rRNA (adenine2503-C2)-methyltransferase